MHENEWKSPEIYKIHSEYDLRELSGDLRPSSIIDPIDVIKSDLFDMRYPDKSDDSEAKSKFEKEIDRQSYSFGKWVYYPWNESLIRLPDSDDYYNLRTYRNRNLITQKEQLILRKKKIAAFGLSVGSNVVDSATISGIGNDYLLFDPDRLTPTNLNRIRLIGATGLGLLKTTITGRRIADLDPYINQAHYPNGYDETSDDILRRSRPDLIIEEVDNLEVKTRLRDIAKELAVPLVMVGDAGDKVILDVERHDIDNPPMFNGKVSKKTIESLRNGSASKKDIEGALMRLIGVSNLSPRLIQSSMLRGKELSGFPQLGTTAGAAGAMAGVAIREIFLDRGVKSGTRRPLDIRKMVGAENPTSFFDSLRIIGDLVNYRKSKK